ncbi:conserved hypothetical protein, partial [Trichinella spiralis]|uniref:hypothetical protein n=1 Tax=Trichinella spiralis TaxID=6334 RepID=UPI0001EFEB53
MTASHEIFQHNSYHKNCITYALMHSASEKLHQSLHDNQKSAIVEHGAVFVAKFLQTLWSANENVASQFWMTSNQLPTLTGHGTSDDQICANGQIQTAMKNCRNKICRRCNNHCLGIHFTGCWLMRHLRQCHPANTAQSPDRLDLDILQITHFFVRLFLQYASE